MIFAAIVAGAFIAFAAVTGVVKMYVDPLPSEPYIHAPLGTETREYWCELSGVRLTDVECLEIRVELEDENNGVLRRANQVDRANDAP